MAEPVDRNYFLIRDASGLGIIAVPLKTCAPPVIFHLTGKRIQLNELDDVFHRSNSTRSTRLPVNPSPDSHISSILGETDLDSVLSEEEQSNWLAAQREFNFDDLAPRITLPKEQYIRYSQAFFRFLKRSDQRQITELIQKYIFLCIPAYQRTEYSFWSLTCLPSTNKSTWPRIAGVNINFMETFVIGHNSGKHNTHWSFINIAKTVIEQHYLSVRAFQKKYPFVDIRERMYRAGGNDQITIQVPELANMSELLSDNAVVSAAGMLNLRLMRKGGTIYAKYHCPQLADAVLG